MADAHHPDGHGHHGPDFRIYVAVGLALSGFTVVSFVCNWAVRNGHEHPESALQMSALAAFIVILSVAIVKATLVGMYFMHLKYEWAKLYFMIIPVFILGTMMVIVLMPDIVVAWHHDQYEVTTPQATNR
jgi:caa(3)-type oxidase subunit IV